MYFMLTCAGAEQREGEREAEMAVKREEMRGRRGSEVEMSVERERRRWAWREGGWDDRRENEAEMAVDRERG